MSNERKKIKSAAVIVFRFKEFDQQDQENHKKNAKKHIGKGYAYARYILDTKGKLEQYFQNSEPSLKQGSFSDFTLKHRISKKGVVIREIQNEIR